MAGRHQGGRKRQGRARQDGHGAPRAGGPARSGANPHLYGIHTVLAALANPARDCRRVVTDDSNLAERLRAAARPLGRDALVEIADRDTLAGLAPEGAVHQGVVLEAAPLPEAGLDEILAPRPAAVGEGGRPAPVVVLDQVTDPQNIGAILRSAAAFGARAVIVQERHTPPVTGALAKAASGALERVALVREINLARTLVDLKEAGYWCIGLDGDAPRNLAEAAVEGPMALVLGAEGRGLRRLVAENCDALAKIPQSDAVESLNVSNAAAVALYELTRAR